MADSSNAADSSIAPPQLPPPKKSYVIKERKISFGRDKKKEDQLAPLPEESRAAQPTAALDEAIESELMVMESELTSELSALRKQREEGQARTMVPDAPKVPPPSKSYVLKERTLSFGKDKTPRGKGQAPAQAQPVQSPSPEQALSPAGKSGLVRARTAKALEEQLGAAAAPMPSAAPLPPPSMPPPSTPPATMLAPQSAAPRSTLFVSHVDWPADRKPFVSYASTPPLAPSISDLVGLDIIEGGPMMGAGVLGG